MSSQVDALIAGLHAEPPGGERVLALRKLSAEEHDAVTQRLLLQVSQLASSVRNVIAAYDARSNLALAGCIEDARDVLESIATH